MEAVVDSITRTTNDEGEKVTVIKAVGDTPDKPEEFDLFGPPGEDSPPLPGDGMTTSDSPGAGNANAVGFLDPKQEQKAQPGEKRIYARASSGEQVIEFWLKGDASLVIESANGKIEMAPNGDVTITGNLVVHGEVTAMAAPPGAAAVKLSTHLHGHPMGPTRAPTPGT